MNSIIVLAAIASTSMNNGYREPIAAPRSSTIQYESRILDLKPYDIRCDTELVQPVYSPAPRPLVIPAFRVRRFSSMHVVNDVDVEFRIDSSGRTHGIDVPVRQPAVAYLQKSDVQPALAVWKFAAGAKSNNCSLKIKIAPKAIGEIEKAVAYRAWALRSSSSSVDRKAIFNQVKPDGSTCYDGRRPTRLVKNLPDYRKIAVPAGNRTYVITAFDIDETGRTANIRIVDSTGVAALNDAAIDAIGNDRYSTSFSPARKGCITYFATSGRENTPAPRKPTQTTYQSNPQTCPAGTHKKWDKLPKLVFPSQFRARRVEGWAYVRYDVAPWGAVNNVSVIKSEPASEFGVVAKSIVRTAKAQKSYRGATGCVKFIRFDLKGKKTPGQDY